MAQEAAGVDGAEGFFEVDAGSEAGDGEPGEVAFEGAAEFSLVGGACRFFCGGRAAVALAADIEPGGTRLSQALDGEAEGAGFQFGVENAADGVAFVRPEMQEALIVFAGDGVLRVGQIERHGAVFKYDGARGFG